MSLIIQEHKSSSYAPRTYHNASVADVTIAIAVDHNTAGEKCTQKAAGDNIIKLPYTDWDSVNLARIVYNHLKKHNCKIVNIAGNGIYTFTKQGVTQEDVNQLVYTILRLNHQYHPLDEIVCGGQTGTDLAGAVAAYKLGIPCVVTMPKGFKMRFHDAKDVDTSEEFVRNLIVEYSSKLS